MAAADHFTITVLGKGAHGSRPEAAIDPILVGAQIVAALQSVVARRVSALAAVVLSVCRFTGGTNGNIIPDTAELEGTVRFLKPAVGERLPEMIEQIVKGVCDTAGAAYRLDYRRPYIPTINNAKVVALASRVVRANLGHDAWADLESPGMGAEDFSYYVREYPGAMFRLGLGTDRAGLHTPQFDFNDEALRNGITFLVAMALEVLGKPA